MLFGVRFAVLVFQGFLFFGQRLDFLGLDLLQLCLAVNTNLFHLNDVEV